MNGHRHGPSAHASGAGSKRVCRGEAAARPDAASEAAGEPKRPRRGRAAASTPGPSSEVVEVDMEEPAAERPPSASGRVPRLTFNPEVLAAEYSPKHSGISPVREKLSLEAMVAHREEVKAAQALECAEDADEEDEGEGVQQVLALRVTSSVPKLRELCRENGLDSHGAKSELIERLIDYVSLDMREDRAERWRAESKRSLPVDEEEEEEEEEVGDFVGPPMPSSVPV